MPEDSRSSSCRTVAEELVRTSTIHMNLSQRFITVTEDRLKIVLRDYAERLAHRRDWCMPASLCTSLLIVLTTKHAFADFLGVSAATWQAGALLLLAVCLVWLFHAGYSTYKARPSLDALIAAIKGSPDDCGRLEHIVVPPISKGPTD